MAYPSSLDELTDGVPSDGTAAAVVLGDATYQHDDHHRALGVAVEATQAELGTDPSGAAATVAARFGTLTADTFTGPVSFAAGSAATPSVTFTSDTDTGVYRIAANELGFATGGVLRATVNSTGLTVVGAGSFSGGVSLTGTASVADRKVSLQGTQVVYLPAQASFPGVVYVGSNGGGSLAAGAAYNTATGLYALDGNTTGQNNSGFGYLAGYLTATGSYNTAIGNESLVLNVAGSYNTAVGSKSLNAATGDNNSALGRLSLFDLATGTNNVAFGVSAGRGITTGSGNTILGASITGLAAGAASLTLVGYQAGLSAPSTATDLVALGTVTAGSMTTPGPGIVALGSSAGRGSTNLSYAALVGHQAGMNSVLTAAQSLVAIGYQAGNGSSGNNSTLVGFQAGQSGTGAFCTAVGFQAGLNNTYADVVLLGRGAVATAVNQFVVGSASSQQTKWIPGHDTDTYLDVATANTWKVYAGGQKGIEVNATGGAPYLGFFGTAAVAKPTGVAVSAAGIHAALVTLGLIAA